MDGYIWMRLLAHSCSIPYGSELNLIRCIVVSVWGGSGVLKEVSAAHAYLLHDLLSLSEAVIVVDSSASLAESAASMIVMGAASVLMVREVYVLSETRIPKSACTF